MNDIDDIDQRYTEALDNRTARAIFKDASLGHVAVLLRKVRELEDDVKRLTALKTPAPADDGDDDEPADCYCSAVHMPPCGWCSNPANFPED